MQPAVWCKLQTWDSNPALAHPTLGVSSFEFLDVTDEAIDNFVV